MTSAFERLRLWGWFAGYSLFMGLGGIVYGSYVRLRKALKPSWNPPYGNFELRQLPLVSLEAMACNAPLVSKRIDSKLYGEVPIVQAGSLKEMVTKTLGIKKMRRQIQKQRDWVARRHSFGAVREQLGGLIDKVENDNILIIGNGTVGQGLEKLYEGTKYRVHIRGRDPIQWNGTPKVMHICFHHNKHFDKAAIDYIKQYNPTLTIIEATVPVGTTEKIARATKSKVVHSPIRGMHNDITSGMRTFTKMIGGERKAAQMAERHYKEMGLTTEVFNSSAETELAKLLSTTQYALNIAFCQEIKRMCDKYGLDFENVYTKANISYNEGYGKLKPNVVRPVLKPGIIGGTCLMQNIELFKGAWESDFLKAIVKSNEKRKKELKGK